MALVLRHKQHVLKFKFKAGTSRGELTEKRTWILKVHESHHPEVYGLGECGPLAGLSIDDHEEYDHFIDRIAPDLKKQEMPSTEEEVHDLVRRMVPKELPALRFGLETALLDLLNEGQRMIFKNRLVASGDKLPINGLIWMGDEAWMKDQIEEKLTAGYSCIKLKIGAIDFDTECKLLEAIRKDYSADQITLRVDANGAFQTNDALAKLKRLAEYELHSIEQPIMPHQPEAMQMICKHSKVPIALDEELIGVHGIEEKRELLRFIKPQYIVLKPTLLGGLWSTREWIDLAENTGIGWWITSALESNIGLNAITQFTASFPVEMPQGLGTGQLYDNNFESPLTVDKGFISYDQKAKWGLDELVFD
ncbi:MAG: o-succinylbenzoate synthase [Cyclobacteriaceae bacterium]